MTHNILSNCVLRGVLWNGEKKFLSGTENWWYLLKAILGVAI